MRVLLFPVRKTMKENAREMQIFRGRLLQFNKMRKVGRMCFYARFAPLPRPMNYRMLLF